MDFLNSKVYVYIDGLTVYEGKLKIFSVKESNSAEVIKRYEPLNWKMNLTRKQKKRLLKGLWVHLITEN